MHNGHQPEEAQAALTTPQAMGRDLLERHQRPAGPLFRWAALALGFLFLLGVVGFVYRAVVDGFGRPEAWGYYVAVFAFLLTTAQAAPMVAIAPRIARAHWRRPVSRAAELFVVVGLFNFLLFIPILFVLPSLANGRRTLWFYEPGKVPAYSPHVWAGLAMAAFALTGLFLLWVSAMPDMAHLRDHGTGWRRLWGRRLARGWLGTTWQWFFHKHRLGILGAFYFMLLVFVQFLVVSDFLMSLVPGWIDALFPATHAANSLQAGVATVLVTMFILRRWGGYRDLIGLDQFWGMGKLLFALSLLWVWFWFSSFNILWYGKKPNEQFALEMMMVGPYLPAFMASFVMNFVVPLFVLVWNPVRKSIWGPPLIALSVLVGTFFDRIRLYVAAYLVATKSPLREVSPADVPAARLPDFADVFMMAGAIAGAILVYMLAARLIPVVSIWEMKELVLYRVHRVYHRAHVMVLGKPE